MFHDLNDLIYIFYEKSTELKKHNPNTCSKKTYLTPKKTYLTASKNVFNKTFRKRFKD